MTTPDADLRAKLEAMSDAELLELSPTLRKERQAAEATLHEFVRQAWPIVEADRPFVDNWHVRLICRHLEALTSDEIGRLLINIPPGCMKSLLTGVFWPCWVWTHSPETRWLFASYSQQLSTRDSVRCRNLIGSPWYQRHWGRYVCLTGDQNQKTYFETTQGGWRMATSVGGRGTGEHPDYIVVDDPHNVVQSESDVQREAALEWWDGTISTRGRSRGVRQVVVMQRLHENDLSGHILSKGGDWNHLCLPMRYEGRDRMRPTLLGSRDERRRTDELLWPELFPERVVEEMERDLGSRRAAGQLQQRPAPADGEMFRRPWFQIATSVPKHRRVVRYWDLAASDGHGDYTVGVLLIDDKDADAFYVVDVVRGRWSIHQRNLRIRETAERDRDRYGRGLIIWIEQEPGASGVAASQYLIGQLRGHNVRTDRVDKAKEVRWEPWAAQLEAGNVFLVKGAWNDAFIQEHLIAPSGSHDDQLDAAAGAFNNLSMHRVLDLRELLKRW